MCDKGGRPPGLEGPKTLSPEALRGGPFGRSGQSPQGLNGDAPVAVMMDNDDKIFVKYASGRQQEVTQRYLDNILKQQTVERWSLGNLLEWLEFRPNRYVTLKDMFELGLFDDIVATHVGEVVDQQAYEVKRITFVPNSNPLHGHYYASDKESGGMSTFWKVQFFTLSAYRMTMRNHYSQEVIELPLQQYHVTSKGFHVPFTDKIRHKVLDTVDKECRSNPNVFYNVDGFGDRNKTSDSNAYLLRQKPIPVTMDRGSCGRCAIANALYLMKGRDAAKDLLDIGYMSDEKLAKISNWLECNYKLVRLNKVDMGIAEVRSWVLNQCVKGVLLLELVGYGDDMDEKSRHIVTIDNREGCGLVYDSVERYAMPLCDQVLQICSGAPGMYLISDVRQVVECAKSKSNRRTQQRKSDRPSRRRYKKKKLEGKERKKSAGASSSRRVAISSSDEE